MSGDAGTIGGGAFDADRDGFSELANPQCQVVVSGCSGVELTVFEQNSGVGDDGGMVGVGVGVDAALDTLSVGNLSHVVASPRLGRGARFGQASDGPDEAGRLLRGYVRRVLTVVLWWPAEGRSTGPEKGTRKARKIPGQAVPSTG